MADLVGPFPCRDCQADIFWTPKGERVQGEPFGPWNEDGSKHSGCKKGGQAQPTAQGGGQAAKPQGKPQGPAKPASPPPAKASAPAGGNGPATATPPAQSHAMAPSTGPANAALATWTGTREQLDLVKRTIFPDSTDDELALYLHECQRRGVHPLDRLVHPQKRKGRVVFITSIDLYRSMADATGKYAGNDDPIITDAEAGPYPYSASVTVYKIVEGIRSDFTATARWEEYYPGEGEAGFMWRKLPRLMLGKVAEGLALRKAFPRQLAGVYVAEEMHQAGPEDKPRIDQDAKPPAGKGKIIDAQVVPDNTPQAVQDEARRKAALKAFHAFLGEKGLKHDQVAPWAREAYHVGTMNELGPVALGEIRERISKALDDGRLGFTESGVIRIEEPPARTGAPPAGVEEEEERIIDRGQEETENGDAPRDPGNGGFEDDPF